MFQNNYCIIMAGGIGSRFWPRSRNSCPKQFLDILDTGRTFLQQTFDRFAKIIPRENILIVTGVPYKDLVMEQLPGIDPSQVLLEPLRRNTAPCIAYATYKILQRNPNATVVVAPSDHLILNEIDFLQVIQSGLHFAAANDFLITLGIKPTRPETNYGYIQMNPADKRPSDNQMAFRVKTFTEKPNAELAKVFVESGEFFWNSGIFIWNLQAIKQALKVHLPDISILFENGSEKYYTPAETAFIQKAYSECPNISIDYGIMEKAKNVYMFAADVGWSDLGTWQSLYMQQPKDAFNNVSDTKSVLFYDVSNSLVASKNKEKLIVLRGLDDYLIIDSDNVLLIHPKGDEEGFKQVVKDLDLGKNEKYM